MATVWVAVTTVTLCTVFAVVLALGQVVAARHRAGGAADLAALAAADRALEGATVACGTARRAAAAQHAEIVRCTVRGEIADVVARSRWGPYESTVRSRAGPPADPRPTTGRLARAWPVEGRVASNGVARRVPTI
ncbi:Rv3654c family TadE-like protein [Streptomyces pratensis]|uniref:Rv3654c family TadE-like protein n=1 Tax=Streptomyces pratensis TaxID=1169025 RepID=UPI003016EA9C